MAVDLRGIIGRHRKTLIGLIAAIAIYALLGFFLAPWLIKKNAIESVDSALGAELRIQTVAVNPFVLSVRIDELAMDDPAGDALLKIEQIFVNLQLSSLFNWAATFAEVRFDSPELYVARDSSGELSLAFLFASDAKEPPPEDAAESGPPRFILQDFAVNNASTYWHDELPREPVSTTLGPVNVRVQDLSTLPQREGRQEVVITTETTGTFSWSGSLQLNPLRSSGHASVEGSHFPLLSAYIRDNTGFEVVRGDAGIDLDYSFDTREDGQFEVRVDNLELAFADVMLRTFGIIGEDGENLDRDVIEIPVFRIDGGALRYPEREVSIGTISVEDSALEVYRDSNGQFAVAHRSAGATLEEAPEPNDSAGSDGADWSVALDRIDIQRISIDLIDDSVTPTAELGIASLDASVSEISNLPNARFPTEVSIRTRAGGSVRIEGEAGVLPSPNADLELAIEEISLALLHPYIKSLADVNLDSGSVAMNLKLHSSAAEKLSLAGDLSISDFLITETDEGSRLGSWNQLAANQMVFSLSNESLEISEIQFDKPYGDILIAADGSVNLGRVAPGRQTTEDVEQVEEAAPESGEAAESEPPPFDVTIGRVVVKDGAADFADQSLPLPFDVKIAELNGSLTTIASASSEPSEAAFEGTVDEFGLVQVAGTITPLQPALNTDLQVNFQNVAMPKFSAYSVPFAGREIASGKLDLNLGYKLEQSELVGENKIVLRDFELGDKVDHPGAASLPLGLAVALLKNPDGTIDIDLPVRGNVDDPEFRYGSVVGKALVNLVVKIATSPFALIGNLVGAEADELESIAFQDGRADLTPPEQEKVGKLAEALTLRPELLMEIYGVIDREADGLAIRTKRFDDKIEQMIEVDADTDADTDLYAEQRLKIYEELFGQDEARRELRAGFTTDGTLDELAYSTELRRQLIAAEQLDETRFIELARRRASNVQAAILEHNAELEAQLSVVELQAVTKDEDAAIEMKVVLKAGGEDG